MHYEKPLIRVEMFEFADEFAANEYEYWSAIDEKRGYKGPVADGENDPGEEILEAFAEVFNITK